MRMRRRRRRRRGTHLSFFDEGLLLRREQTCSQLCRGGDSAEIDFDFFLRFLFVVRTCKHFYAKTKSSLFMY
jgi:hypothetical protein